jgi:hypothetical protein
MNKIFALSVLVISAISGTVVPAHAAYVVTATETDGDVVFEGSGSLDLTAWSFSGTTNRIGGLDQPSVLLGRFNAVPVDDYANASKFSGPSSIGSGSPFVRASSGSGDYTGLNPDAIALFVPSGYSSGDALSTSTTFAGQTFLSLGLNPGSYVWTWGEGEATDSYTLNITTVPVPAAAWLFGSALAGLTFIRRKQS